MQRDAGRVVVPLLAFVATLVIGGAFVMWMFSFYGDDAAPAASRTATATSSPAVSASSSTPTATPTSSPTTTPTATPSPPPTSTPAPAPPPSTPTPEPTAPATPAPPPPPPGPPTFVGVWRLTDTVEVGAGAGERFSFDVTIRQTGDALAGSSGGALIFAGTLAGDTATLRFTQPALGVTGVFTWTLQPDGSAAGSFSTSVPNSGSSYLERPR